MLVTRVSAPAKALHDFATYVGRVQGNAVCLITRITKITKVATLMSAIPGDITFFLEPLLP